VLGEIIDSLQFSQAILEAAVNAKNIDEILKSIEIQVDEEYIAQMRENLVETLASRYIDYTRIKDLAQKAREYRLIPEYTQNFFIKAFEKSGGRVKKLQRSALYFESIPFEIRKIADNEAFKKCFGSILRRYPEATFDKEFLKINKTAEFISFGHPLFEAILQWVEDTFFHTLSRGALFYDPDGKLNGYILFYEGEIKDGTGAVAGKRLLSIYLDEDNNAKTVPPSIIWDLAEENNPPKSPLSGIESMRENINKVVNRTLEAYKAELYEERKRQAEIKQRYGVNSLEYLIIKLDEELIGLEERKAKGENVDLVIRNKQERKAEYEKALWELNNLIEKEQSLTMSAPKFLGIIQVKPWYGKETEMVSDAQVEAEGMRVAMEYEQKQGRIPEDVSAQNLGFDIRSKDSVAGTVRYIEVKARARSGAVALTQNEWFKAQRFGNEYYLYVVFNTATNPELHIIPNPAETLMAEEKVEIVRYLVNDKEIFSKGIKA